MKLKNPNDIVGQKFGRLTIVDYVGYYSTNTCKYKHHYYKCKCDCGNECVAKRVDLIRGDKKSCGCLLKEHQNNLGFCNKKHNQYYVYNDIVFVKYSNCNEYFICDLDDWKKLSQYCWYKNVFCYPASRVNGKTVLMHSLILNTNGKYIIDHKNRISIDGVCDNRKSNLRLCTQSQNGMNRGLQKNNKSGHAGVYFDKRTNLWEAYIKYQNKRHHLGYYHNYEDAVKVREESEIKYFGDFRGCA